MVLPANDITLLTEEYRLDLEQTKSLSLAEKSMNEEIQLYVIRAKAGIFLSIQGDSPLRGIYCFPE
ncbi:hypothetical protein KKA14_13175 [bacterium]|nr:hypothetical protein [bacterium]